jgi:phosphotransferase system HPr (HPr) family protein
MLKPLPLNQEYLVPSIKGQIQVLDPIGLHARPASQIVNLVQECGLEVTLGRAGEDFAKASSVLRLLALKIKCGETLTVAVETPDQLLAEQVIAKIEKMLRGD